VLHVVVNYYFIIFKFNFVYNKNYLGQINQSGFCKIPGHYTYEDLEIIGKAMLSHPNLENNPEKRVFF
jgi:hypothetical protein